MPAWWTLLLPLTLAVSPNLVDNGGFEMLPPGGGAPDGWQLPAPPEGFAGADTAVHYIGQASLRVTVPDGAPLSWYSASRAVGPLKRGATYTMSAMVRTENAHGGVGAYISLNAFDGTGKRIGIFDGGTKVTGTKDWHQVVVSAKVPDGTSELRAIFCIHGYGSAWFDNAQVEEGTEATDYQPSEADRRMQQKQAADAVEATPWLKALPPRPKGKARIGVLDLAAPG